MPCVASVESVCGTWDVPFVASVESVWDVGRAMRC